MQDQGTFDNLYAPDPSTLNAVVTLVSPSYEAFYSPSVYTLIERIIDVTNYIIEAFIPVHIPPPDKQTF
jgi:hypothetical protein